MKMVCKLCGKPEEDHCVFEPMMPEGCICDPGEWSGEINMVCDQFVGDKKYPCRVCEHDYQCHR